MSDRRQFYQRLGTMSAVVQTELAPALLRGAAQWPCGRPAYRDVQLEGSVLYATDGLSDGSVALMELYVEIATSVKPPVADGMRAILRAVADVAAAAPERVLGGVTGGEPLTIELDGSSLPNVLWEMNRRGIAMIGPTTQTVPDRFESEAGSVPFIRVVPLHAAEIAMLKESADPMRQRAFFSELLTGRTVPFGGRPFVMPGAAAFLIDPEARYNWWLDHA